MILKLYKKIFSNSSSIFLGLSLTVFFASFLFCFSFFGFSVAEASTEIYLSPVTQNIKVGDKFIVNLKISVSEKSINVIDGTVFFDKDKIEIKEINTSNSILTIWPKPAVFDNTKGELSFVGGVGNGFVGQDGQVLEIVFLAKTESKTKIDFKDSFSVFLNDGQGTQINPWLKPTEISIVSEEQNIEQPQNNFLQDNFVVNKSGWLIISAIVMIFVIIFIVRKYVTFK